MWGKENIHLNRPRVRNGYSISCNRLSSGRSSVTSAGSGTWHQQAYSVRHPSARSRRGQRCVPGYGFQLPPGRPAIKRSELLIIARGGMCNKLRRCSIAIFVKKILESDWNTGTLNTSMLKWICLFLMWFFFLFCLHSACVVVVAMVVCNLFCSK